jgi:hypothetical protein
VFSEERSSGRRPDDRLSVIDNDPLDDDTAELPAANMAGNGDLFR